MSVVVTNKDKRLDSDFFTKGTKKNNSLEYRKIGTLLHASEYGVSIEMNEDSEGVQIYRMNEIHNMLCDLATKKYAQLGREEIEQYLLKDGDILYNRTNSYEMVGRCGMYYSIGSAPQVFASYLVRLYPKHKLLKAEYLAAFLNTRQGISEIRRRARQSVNQTNVNPEEVKEIEIPLLSMGFQERIQTLFHKAHHERVVASELYKDAELLLLRELGFTDWLSPTKIVAVRKYSDFVSAGRFDAEYFQPKYDDLMNRLGELEVRNLGGNDGLTSFYKSVEPGSECYGDKGVPFIRIADFSEFGIEEVGVHIPPELCVDCRRPKKNTILFSKDGSVGIAYKVDEDLDAITSSGILHLTVRDDAVHPDYLTLVLNSMIVRLQAERDAGGSIIQHWKPSEIAKVIIPILPKSKQEAIVAKVQSSFAARKESKRLLELAKFAVELAIEQGESAGMELLNHE